MNEKQQNTRVKLNIYKFGQICQVGTATMATKSRSHVVHMTIITEKQLNINRIQYFGISGHKRVHPLDNNAHVALQQHKIVLCTRQKSLDCVDVQFAQKSFLK